MLQQRCKCVQWRFPGDPADLQAMLPLVVKGEALCSALPLIVAAALANAVHIAPVGLRLRVLQRVSIYLQHENACNSASLPTEQLLSSYSAFSLQRLGHCHIALRVSAPPLSLDTFACCVIDPRVTGRPL